VNDDSRKRENTGSRDFTALLQHGRGFRTGLRSPTKEEPVLISIFQID
jgi:hypothetical protein